MCIEGFDPEKQVLESDSFPPLEHPTVTQQNVASRFQIEPLPDAGARDGLCDLECMSLVNEGDIVNNEHAGLADCLQVFCNASRAALAVATAIEGPGAAEGAVPRTAARKLDGSTGIEVAQEVLVSAPQQMQGGLQIVEAPDENRPRPRAALTDASRYLCNGCPILPDGIDEGTNTGFALASEHAVNRAVAIRKNGISDERGAMSADADE